MKQLKDNLSIHFFPGLTLHYQQVWFSRYKGPHLHSMQSSFVHVTLVNFQYKGAVLGSKQWMSGEG